MKVFFDQWAWWTFYSENIPYIDQIPASERAAFDASIKDVYKSGTFAHLWYDQHRIRGALGDDHVRYVDNLLAQPG